MQLSALAKRASAAVKHDADCKKAAEKEAAHQEAAHQEAAIARAASRHGIVLRAQSVLNSAIPERIRKALGTFSCIFDPTASVANSLVWKSPGGMFLSTANGGKSWIVGSVAGASSGFMKFRCRREACVSPVGRRWTTMQGEPIPLTSWLTGEAKAEWQQEMGRWKAEREAEVERRKARRETTAETVPSPNARVDLNSAVSTHKLFVIQYNEVHTKLTAESEDAIDRVAQTQWPDFSLKEDLAIDSLERKFDFILYMRDENADIVGFRSCIWDSAVGAWRLENGVVRDKSNGLGSIFMQLIVKYILMSAAIDDSRRSVTANVEPGNDANLRLYNMFQCRAPGPHQGSGFERISPSSMYNDAAEQWSEFRFPPSPRGRNVIRISRATASQSAAKKPKPRKGICSTFGCVLADQHRGLHEVQLEQEKRVRRRAHVLDESGSDGEISIDDLQSEELSEDGAEDDMDYLPSSGKRRRTGDRQL